MFKFHPDALARASTLKSLWKMLSVKDAASLAHCQKLRLFRHGVYLAAMASVGGEIPNHVAKARSSTQGHQEMGTGGCLKFSSTKTAIL